jgi:hypothetical protein
MRHGRGITPMVRPRQNMRMKVNYHQNTPFLLNFIVAQASFFVNDTNLQFLKSTGNGGGDML